MKAGLDSWKDSVEGAYSAQALQVESSLAVMDAANQTALANLKLAHTWTDWIIILKDINKAAEIQMEMEQQLDKMRFENAQKVIAQFGNYVNMTDEYIKKQDAAVHAFQTERGLTAGQTASFEKYMFGMGETFAKYNKTIEDALKMQSQYAEASGRAVNYSRGDYEKNFAVGRLVGEDNLSNISAQLNLFGVSVSKSADIMYDTYRDIGKMGLSQKKVVKDIASNLKLANKYDFKGGTKGFMEVAKWAENARFNLSSLAGALEKVQGGGLEGVIKQSAGLQVLGGNFAMGANPLNMLYNAGADPAEYAKTMQRMFAGLGTFHAETGETTFNWNENMQIREAAERLGISVEDAKNMARGMRQKGSVLGQMGNSTLSSESKDTIANMAHYNQESGRWEVTTLGGGTMDVSKVTERDMGSIVSGNKEEDAAKYVQGTYSLTESIDKTTKAIAAKLGIETFDDFVQTTEKANKQVLDTFGDNIYTIAKGVEWYRKEGLEAQKKMLEDLLNGIDEKIKAAFDTVDVYIDKNNKRFDEMKEWLDERKVKEEAATAKAEESQEALDKIYEEAKGASYFGNIANGVKVNSARVKATSDWADEQYAKGNYVRYISGKASAWGIKNFGYRIQLISNLLGINAASVDNVLGSILDGYVQGNGSPMMVNASNVTPIQDGSVKLARSDPKDSAIFAKTGGPFDTLFNGVFNKVNAIDNYVHYATANSNYGSSSKVSALYNQYGNSSVVANTDSKYMGGVSSEVSSYTSNRYGDRSYEYNNGGDGRAESNANASPVEVRISGDINLRSSNGESVSIGDMMRKDPMFVRRITEMVLMQINNNENGGRNIPNHRRFT